MTPLSYQEWVRREAEAVRSDGCTSLTQWYRDCCLEHDLAYRHGKDPQDAYLRCLLGQPDYWRQAQPISRRAADLRLSQCMQRQSPFSLLDPLSYIRFAGVRLFNYLRFLRDSVLRWKE